jgi:hypothetical protein
MEASARCAGNHARVVRCVASGVAALAFLAGCGEGERPVRSGAKATPEPRQLVVQPSDLPAGFSLVAGETFRVSLATVVADPWSQGSARLIRGERVGGYQTSLWTPEHRRIECSAAVFRSPNAARIVFGRAARRLAGIAKTESSRAELGDETQVLRFDRARLEGFGVRWRYEAVLAACTSLRRQPSDLEDVLNIAGVQQERMARALG